MWSTCLFCSAPLGRNEAIENFPVGSRVAFDAAKGRLWAVCARCGRWNLAPIEERWEAVEEAERLFRDTRTRVQSERIGQARVRDGTRLVRVGAALPGELAAWRYGTQLISRRNRNLMFGGALVSSAVVLAAGMPMLLSAGVPITMFSSGLQLASVIQSRRERLRIIHQVDADDSPTRRPLVIRRQDLYEAELVPSLHGGVGIQLQPSPSRLRTRGFREPEPLREPVRLEGDDARQVISRALVVYNHRGARPKDVEAAVQAIEQAGGADELARQAARSGALLVRPQVGVRGNAAAPAPTLRQVLGTFRGEVLPVNRHRNLLGDDRPRLSKTDALALEMALNEEAERRALEGELAALESAWREAEEIARIADALPDEPPD